jgi:fucose permease
VSLYWGSILAGRIVFGFVVERIGVDVLVRASTAVALTGSALFCWNPARFASPLALGLCGLGLAVIFPCLMTRTPQRFGQAVARHAVGFQVGAAMLGAALLPSVAGWIAQTAGVRHVAGALLTGTILLFVLHEAVLRSDRSRTARGH